MTPGNTYGYRVRAHNGPVVASAWSATATANVPAVPAAPTGIAGVVQTGPSISVTWADVATTEQGHTLQHSVNGGAWATIQPTMAANSSGYVDTNVALGTTYAYQVRAYNVPGTAPRSPMAARTTSGCRP